MVEMKERMCERRGRFCCTDVQGKRKEKLENTKNLLGLSMT